MIPEGIDYCPGHIPVKEDIATDVAWVTIEDQNPRTGMLIG